jgi:electron transfer flavoprotein alpha subunit
MLAPITYELLGVGRQLAASLAPPRDLPATSSLAAVLVGSGVRPLAEDLAAHGAERVYVADASRLGSYLAEAYTPIVVQAVREAQPAVVLFGHTANGRELAPRVAFRLGCALVTDCTDLRIDPPGPDGTLVLTKPVYGGSAVAEFVAEEPAACQMATVRPRTFEPAERQEGRREAVVELEAALDAEAQRARVVETVREAAEGPRLKDAKIVVSGGRGLGGPENWHYVEELAAALGAAIGASRAVTDSGWVPASLQVGLTGTTVCPDLYITVGISGAVQHMAGCAGARSIVAINRDPNANIFRHARYGVVGDYRQVLPALIERIKELRGHA